MNTVRLMAKFSGQLPRLGLVFLADFEFYMAVWGVGSGPIGFGAPWRSKMRGSKPVESNLGSVPIDVHELMMCRKAVVAS